MPNKTLAERRAELIKLIERDRNAFEELYRKTIKRPGAIVKGSGLYEVREILHVEFPESKAE